MKKRVLSVLLVIALLVAVGIVAAQANESDPTPDQIKAEAEAVIQRADDLAIDPENPVAVCPYCQGEAVRWTNLASVVNTDKKNAHFGGLGHYYVDGNLESNYTFHNVSNGIPCVFLNPGSTVTVHGNVAFMSSMRLMGNGTVQVATIPADEETGTAAKVPDNIVQAGSSANGMHIYGGIYTAAEGTTPAGGVIYGHGTTMKLLNIYGGTFEDLGSLPALRAYNGAVANIYGGNFGTVRLHNSSNAGNGKINIYGGNITNVQANDGILLVEGGQIGTITSQTNMDSITISGNPKIGNLGMTVKPTFGALTSGASIGFGTATAGTVISTPYNTKPEAEAIAATFPAMPGKTVTVNDAYALVLQDKTYTNEEIAALSKEQNFGNQAVPVEKFCYACGKTKTWQPLVSDGTYGANLGTGHYYLPNSIQFIAPNSGEFYGYAIYDDNANVCFHLNGQSMTTDAYGKRNYSTIYANAGCLNLFGNENSKLTGTAMNWAPLEIRTGKTVNIYGGVFVANQAGTNRYAVNYTNRGTVNFYGGKIEAGKLNFTGAGTVNINVDEIFNEVYVKAGTLNLNNTTVTKLTVGGGVANIGSGSVVTTVDATAGGEVNVNGGTVTTLKGGAGTANVNSGNVTTLTTGAGATNVAGGIVNTLTATAGDVVLSGAPTVNNLTTSVAVDAKGLTSGAKITLGNVDGVFTTEFDSMQLAEDAKAYFVGTAGMVIKTTDAKELTYVVLACTTPPEIIDFANNEMPNVAGFKGNAEFKAFCPHCNKTVTWKALTATSSANTSVSQSHYFLAEDRAGIYCDSDANVGGSVLFLNGKTINGNIGCGDKKMITILGNGNVTATSAAALTGVGTFNIYGGTYARNATGNNIASVAANGPFNFYGGTITAAEDFSIFMHSGQYYINGGTVEGRLYMDNNGANPSFTLNGGTMNDQIGIGRGTVTLDGGTFNGTEIGVGGSATHATALNLGGVTFTEDVKINNHGQVGVVTFGANFDQTVTVSIAPLTKEAGYGRTETLYKATDAGLKATIYAEDVDDNVFGLVYDDDKKDGSLVVAKTSIVNGENVSWYQDLQAAVDAFNGTGIIKLYTDLETAALDNKTIAIDLNGKKAIAVSGTGSIVGMDTFTQDAFDRTPGYVLIAEGANITVAAPETPPAADGTVTGFLPVTDDNGETTFTYYTMKLSGVALKANKTTVGMYFKGTWNFNDNLPAGKVEAGVAVNVKDQNVENPFEGGIAANTANGYYSTDAASVANGQPVTSVLVNDIMKAEGREAAKNSEYGQMKIKAAAFVAVNGQEIVTGIKNLSVKDILDMFELEENVEKYNAMETKLGKFYQTWAEPANLSSWNLKKIPYIEIAA